MNKRVNILEFRIEPYYDKDIDQEFEHANIYVDGESLATKLQVQISRVPLPSQEIDETIAFNQFHGQSPENLLLHLLNLRYVSMPNNDNHNGNILLLNCWCDIPYCSSIYCEIEQELDVVTWRNFYLLESPKIHKIENFLGFTFSRKNYEEQVQVLQNWVNEKGIWKEGDMEENLPQIE